MIEVTFCHQRLNKLQEPLSTQFCNCQDENSVNVTYVTTVEAGIFCVTKHYIWVTYSEPAWTLLTLYQPVKSYLINHGQLKCCTKISYALRKMSAKLQHLTKPMEGSPDACVELEQNSAIDPGRSWNQNILNVKPGLKNMSKNWIQCECDAWTYPGDCIQIHRTEQSGH